jgi:hypothetical protein
MSAGDRTLTLSLCMIVRDEEENLGRCLESVRGVVDEIVIVDTGSKDRTIEIARGFGAIVLEEAWADDFSTPRNHAMDRATKDWILGLAADEEVEAESGRRMRDVVSASKAQGLRTTIRNLTPAGEVAAFHESLQTRLVERRDEYRYEGVIHEQVVPSILRGGGVIEDTDLVIIHHGYQKDAVQGGKSRAKRNLALLEKQVKLSPKDPHILYNLGCTYKAVGDLPQAKRALEAAEANDHGRLDVSAREGLHMRLAQIALAEKKDAVAVDRARKTLTLAPDNPVALQVLALGLMTANDVSGAVAAFTTLRRSPSVSRAFAADLDKLLAHLAPGARQGGQ